MRQGDEGWSGIRWRVGESGEGLRKIIGEMTDGVYCILRLKGKYEIKDCTEKHLCVKCFPRWILSVDAVMRSTKAL